jgi:hypothetical protein
MSVSLEKNSFDFSIRIAELVRYLREDGKGFPLCERLLFCGVNAGLCIRGGRKREAAELLEEADYIIEMAVAAGYLTPRQDVHIRADCGNLMRVLKDGRSVIGEAAV